MSQTLSPAAVAIDWREAPWTLPAPTRSRIDLDGVWDFSPDSVGTLTLADWQGGARPTDLRQIRVPIPWQAQFDDLRDYMGIAWYRRQITIPDSWASGVFFLGIGAADYYTEAWLDGEPLGAHEGGYLPFSFALPAASGDHELVIKVTDPSDDRRRFPAWPFSEIPHGKQSWYGPVGGIWQSVYLEQRPVQWIEQLFCTPDLPGAAVDVQVALSSAPSADAELALVLLDPAGLEIARQNVDLNPLAPADALPCAHDYAEQGRLVGVRIPIPQPRLWSPANPALYSIRATLGDDTLEDYFGMRRIETRDGRVLLNGEPIYLFAALDQDYYPDTIYTPPSTEFLFDQFKKARELGLNMLRTHIKVADPRYYQVADRMGVLIWTEIPNWENRTLAAGERGYQTFAAMARRDWNHASIVIWTLINEDWGVELRHNPRDRDWLAQFYHDARVYDPTRLIVDNSACFSNFHLHSDLEDYHNYSAIPDHRHAWDRWVAALASRVYWTYGHDGKPAEVAWNKPLKKRRPQQLAQVRRSGNEPIILSEFGNWGLPNVANLYEDGHEPWWFSTGFDWGPVYPHDVELRFKYYHLDKVFGNYAAMADLSQQQQYLALKYEIESIRQHSSISGYVITEFADVHWECNGLLDMRRNTKSYHHSLAALNSPTVLIPRPERYSYWAGETAQLAISLSHWGAPLTGCVLRYSAPGLDIAGSLVVPTVSSGETVVLGILQLALPADTTTQKARLQLQLFDADGVALAESYEELYVFAQSERRASGRIAVWEADAALNAALAGLGYEIVALPDAEISICVTITAEVREHIQRGGKVLALLSNKRGIVAPVDQIRAVARKGRHWHGNWASNFNWYRQDIAFKSLPGDKRFDLAFSNVTPDYVLTGFAHHHFAADVLAGIFVGWVHDNAVLAGLRHYGYGQVLLTTLKLLPNLRRDPLAVRLLHELITHLNAS